MSRGQMPNGLSEYAEMLMLNRQVSSRMEAGHWALVRHDR